MADKPEMGDFFDSATLTNLLKVSSSLPPSGATFASFGLAFGIDGEMTPTPTTEEVRITPQGDSRTALEAMLGVPSKHTRPGFCEECGHPEFTHRDKSGDGCYAWKETDDKENDFHQVCPCDRSFGNYSDELRMKHDKEFVEAFKVRHPEVDM